MYYYIATRGFFTCFLILLLTLGWLILFHEDRFVDPSYGEPALSWSAAIGLFGSLTFGILWIWA